MQAESTIPILPCRDLDDLLPFYQALGFEVTYRQTRPNPYAAVRRGGIDLHFFGLGDFDPATSLGSVIILVPDTQALYDAFATGLRGARGSLPLRGIPRITRPRRKQGTASGFTVVDPGGNWLRISARDPGTGDSGASGAAAGDSGASGAAADGGGAVDDLPRIGGRLERVLANAARQGDAHGDERAAIAVLDAGLARHDDAPALDRLPALVYLAELLIRTGDRARALATLAQIDALELDDSGRAIAATELAAAAELRRDL